MDAQAKEKIRLDGITAFRFIAAFYVFVFHLFANIPANVPSFMGVFLYNGAVGMSFFFVLSGFILTYNHKNSTGDNYFAKRLIRIFPVYLACGILTYPFLYNQLITNEHDTLKFIITNGLFLTATQSWFYTSFPTWNFGGTWSVSVEMFFYAMFPILLKLANTKNIYVFSGIAFFAAATIMPVSMLYQSGLTNENMLHFVLYPSPIFRLPEFAMGIAAAKLMDNGLKINHVTMAIAVGALLYALNLPSYGWMMHAYIVVPALCAIMIYLATHKLPSKAKILMKPFVFLGEISYSFYLMQIVLIKYITTYKPEFIYSNGFLGWAIVAIAVTVLSTISYYTIEKKLSSFLLKKLRAYSENKKTTKNVVTEGA